MVVCSSGGGSSSLRPRRTTAVLECSQCRRKFLNEADRELHMREAHQSVRESYECSQCGKQFGNRHILQLHTRLHASQSSSSSSPEPPSSDSITTLTSTTQSNGSLNINFNVSLNINLGDSLDPSDLDSKLNDLLTNAAKASFQEALKREKRFAEQQKNDSFDEGTVEKSPDGCSTKSSRGLSSPLSGKSESDESVASSNEENKDADVEVEPSESSQSLAKVEPVSKPKGLTPSIRVNPHNRTKKTVGLTKIRMEDCQRCDACSCIYLDERDYVKHMKNFHKQDVLKKEPIKVSHKKAKQQAVQVEKRQTKRQKQLQLQQIQQQQEGAKKGSCRSCCKQCKCRGDHGTLEPMLPIVRPVLGRSGRRGSSSSLQDSWNQLAQHLEGAEGVVLHAENVVQIKPDPEGDAGIADFTDLLSQVEVKIKTESVDQDEAPIQVKLEPLDNMDTDSCPVY